jgi:peroxiredoxin (alkyl hydroperoxide reductase subunit C)
VELKALDVEVLAISTDSQFVHQAWHEAELSKMVQGGIPFPMVSDAGGRIGQVYGVYDPDECVDIRGRFIIDPDFNIRSMEILSLDVGRNPLELIRQIKAYRYVCSTGEVTPSGWQPGQSGLKTSAELVGKVYQAWKP